jgi:hypothetical protein
MIGCSAHATKPAAEHGDLKMYNCLFEANGHLHFHVAPKRGRVTVVSDYTPGRHKTHALDLKDGKESEAKLLPSIATVKYAFEVFLFNDSFGQSAQEKATFFVDHNGRARLEGSRPDAARRLIDSGQCKLG